jgi:toxin YoeB
MYTIKYDKTSLKQLNKLQGNSKYLLKLAVVIQDIKLNPYSPSFKFERLKENLSGYCSKRITQGDRVVYKVIDNIVEVQIRTVKGHYHDK